MFFDVITLFPEMFDAITQYGITRRAAEQGKFVLRTWNPRDFTSDNHRAADDRPYGGGPGMVMQAEPLQQAIAAAQQSQASAGVKKSCVIHLSPQGRPLTHDVVKELLARDEGLILLAGRYEGVDERLLEKYVDEELSIGDYVLSGGELAAMVVMDAMLRLLPGVLNDGASAVEDSFSPARDGLLDHPHYTRPEQWNNAAVPSELMSGNHAGIALWRRRMALERTWQRRPELLEGVTLTQEELRWLGEIRLAQAK